MEFQEVVRTTFAARAFKDEPVDDATLTRILEDARFAPSGGNRQPWKVVVVKDAEKRMQVAECCVPVFQQYLAQRMAGENPWNTIEPTKLTPAEIAAAPAPTEMLQGMMSAPALLAIFVDLRAVASFDSLLDRVGVISGASIYPFVWNILLSARNQGYAGTITTFAAGDEPEMQKLFDMPAYMAAAAVVPLGRPVKQLTKLRRNAVEAFATIDSADGPPLGT